VRGVVVSKKLRAEISNWSRVEDRGIVAENGTDKGSCTELNCSVVSPAALPYTASSAPSFDGCKRWSSLASVRSCFLRGNKDRMGVMEWISA
jgi:hypothetical protein